MRISFLLPALLALFCALFFIPGCQENPALVNAFQKTLKINPVFWPGEGWLGLGERRVLSESGTLFVAVENEKNFLERYENGNFVKLHEVFEFFTFKIWNGQDSIACLSYKEDESTNPVVISIRGDTILQSNDWTAQNAVLTGNQLSIYGSFHQHEIVHVDSVKMASLKPLCRYSFVRGISDIKNNLGGKDFRQLRNCDTGQSVLLPWEFTGYCQTCGD